MSENSFLCGARQDSLRPISHFIRLFMVLWVEVIDAGQFDAVVGFDNFLLPFELITLDDLALATDLTFISLNLERADKKFRKFLMPATEKHSCNQQKLNLINENILNFADD